MNPKTTIAIAVAFMAALTTLFVFKYREIPTAKKKAEMKTHVLEQLYDVPADDVTEVTLKRGDEELHFVHSASGDRWQMKKPLDVLADSSRVRDIVTALKNLQRKASRRAKDKDRDQFGVFEPKNTSELAQYKLDSPTKIVTLTYKPKGSQEANRQVTLQVGDTTADGDGLYVKQPDEPFVYVVNKFNLDSLDKKAPEFRQRKLATISRWDADQVHLQWPERKLAAEKHDSKWRLTEPVADRADQTKLGDMLGKLADIKADSDADFVDDNATDLAKYGLDKPQLIAEISKDSIIQETKEKEPAQEKSKAKDKAKESDKKKEPFTEKILIGSAVEGQEKVYAKIADQNYVVAVAASVLADLDKQPNDLRSRDLVDVTQSDVDYVRVDRPGSTIALGKKDFDWQIYQPKTTRAESSAVSDFVKKIDDLEIKEFIDQGDAKDFELDHPAVTVALYQKGLKEEEKDKDSKAKDKKAKDKEKKDEKKEEAEGPPEPKGTPIQVLFGKRDEEKKLVYVRRGEEPGIFAVSDEGLWDILNRDYLAYRRREVLSFSEPSVAKLSVYRDGKTFSVERKEEKQGETAREVWRLTEPVDAPADSSSVSDILFNFTHLNAKKFIAEGASDLKPYGLDEPKIRATVTLKADGDKKPEQHVLLVGSELEEDGGHFAKLGDGDLVFTVEQRIVNYLGAELHDHSLLKFDATKVEGMTLTWPDAKLELANRKPEGKTIKEWSIVGEADFKLDMGKPRTVVSFLASLNADKFAQYQGDFKPEYGLEQPALLIEIKIEGETARKTVRIGAAAAEGDQRYVATAEKSGPVALLPEDRVKDLLSGPKHFALAEEKKPEAAKSEEANHPDAKPEDSDEPPAKPEEKKERNDNEKQTDKPDDNAPPKKSQPKPNEGDTKNQEQDADSP